MPDQAEHRRAALAAFYTAQHRRLHRAVASRTFGADDAVIADAYGHAWLQLVRRSDAPLDHHGLRWLLLTATHEAWRLADHSRERPSGTLGPDADADLAEPAGDTSDPLE